MKYTEHKLTDPMLQRLSGACAKRGTYRGGNSMYALLNRSLVTMHLRHGGSVQWMATDAGRAALEQARREGW